MAKSIKSQTNFAITASKPTGQGVAKHIGHNRAIVSPTAKRAVQNHLFYDYLLILSSK